MDTTKFLGIEFANLTYQEVLSELDKLSHADSFSYIITPNVDHVVQLYEGQDKSVRMLFNEAYNDATFCICDSRILQLLAKIQGIKLDVVTGSDLTALLFESGYLDGREVVIVGGDDRILTDLSARFPNVGLIQHQPPMKLLCDHKAREAVKNFIAESGCNFVLFAVGAPQSEIIAHACRNDENVRGVGICVGASIEFLLGRKTRAPRWMRRLGLEWLFRLIKEPRRLSRRYLIDGPKIFKLWLCK